LEKDSGTSVQCFFPTGRTILRKGDRIHILAPETEMENMFRHAGLHEKPLRRVGIVGGGRIGSLIAEGLFNPVQKNINAKGEKKKFGILSILNLFTLKSSRRVVIIEQDYNVCKELSARFPDAIVLNEDISNENFILEERIGDLDLIITATTSQELNIIAAIYLKSLGVKRAIAMVNGSGYENIARRLDVDVVIPVQSVVTDSIISKLTGKGIREIHSLGDGSIEMFETEISGDSPAAEKPITEFGMAKAGLIMLVKRDDVSFIPRGDYVFKPGDKLVIIVKSGNESELDKFFGIA
jgi:trk system potassium uptake protein TrkA